MRCLDTFASLAIGQYQAGFVLEGHQAIYIYIYIYKYVYIYTWYIYIYQVYIYMYILLDAGWSLPIKKSVRPIFHP